MAQREQRPEGKRNRRKDVVLKKREESNRALMLYPTKLILGRYTGKYKENNFIIKQGARRTQNDKLLKPNTSIQHPPKLHVNIIRDSQVFSWTKTVEETATTLEENLIPINYK